MIEWVLKMPSTRLKCCSSSSSSLSINSSVLLGLRMMGNPNLSESCSHRRALLNWANCYMALSWVRSWTPPTNLLLYLPSLPSWCNHWRTLSLPSWAMRLTALSFIFCIQYTRDSDIWFWLYYNFLSEFGTLKGGRLELFDEFRCCN